MLDELASAQKIIQAFYLWPYIVLTWELASHGKQKLLVKAKGYMFLSNY